jgi:hypothetical protein
MHCFVQSFPFVKCEDRERSLPEPPAWLRFGFNELCDSISESRFDVRAEDPHLDVRFAAQPPNAHVTQ